MTKFKLTNLLIASCLLSTAVNAQSVKAVVGQANQVQLKIENQKSDQCNIEVTFPNGNKGEFVTSKPDYVVNIEFNPTSEGTNTFSWQGKFRMRGLKSLGACEGSGKLTLSAVPNNETKIQRWREVASKISDKQKTCINAGLKIVGESFDVNALAGEIKNDVNEPISKEIRSRCEKFSDVVLAKNSTCRVNEKQTLCDEYFEITIAGSKKQFMENQLFDYLFLKDQVQKLSVENSDAKNKREIAEAEEERKLEAYKKTPAYKKEQAELANKKAIEEARIKKEQAENEKNRLRDEAIAKQQSEEAAKKKIASMKEFVYLRPNASENTVSEAVFLDVCSKTEYANLERNYVSTVTEYALFDSNATQLVSKGGADIQVQDIYVSNSNKCIINFTVRGVLNGTTVNLNGLCLVTKIVKLDNGKFKAQEYLENRCSRKN